MTSKRIAPATLRMVAASGLAVCVAGGLTATGLSAGAATAAPHARPAAAKKLVGTFTIAPGKSHGKGATGSYFRMITATGDYLSNASSGAANTSYTLLSPGTDKGLETGRYQPEPSPAFDKRGDALADRIIQPLSFESTKFSESTASVDPQTKAKAPAPLITLHGHKLTGNLAAFGASWNNQQFNQGSPKPSGTPYPGKTTKVTGTYNPSTHVYTLTWKSQIVGGPFNGFAGLWHLTGKFIAR
jgi:hypothetical protein